MEETKRIMGLLWDMFNKMMWLNEQSLKKALDGYKPSEIHCIDYIGNNSETNVTQLADAFYMTRGAISKLTKKLIAKSLIESYQKNDNKKEVYFRLTKQGQELFKIHSKLHNSFDERDRPVFGQLSKEDTESIIHFAKTYNEHLDEEISKMGLDMKSAMIDKM